MPTDHESGLVEPDIIVNGRPLTFAECTSVRVAVSSMRISLADPAFRAGIGEPLAGNYDRHLARVEQTMLQAATNPFHAHLAKCRQCRNYPSGCCAVGAALLRAEGTRS